MKARLTWTSGIIHNQSPCSSSVVRFCNGSVALLTSSIPNLGLYFPALNLYADNLSGIPIDDLGNLYDRHF